MERSKSSLIGVTLGINHSDEMVNNLNADELFSLFAGCTRLRSLHIIGEIIICKLLDTLHAATHIRSLSLDIVGRCPAEPADNNMFGGQVPICDVRCASSQPEPATSLYLDRFFEALPTIGCLIALMCCILVYTNGSNHTYNTFRQGPGTTFLRRRLFCGRHDACCGQTTHHSLIGLISYLIWCHDTSIRVWSNINRISHTSSL
jgi:hypothetical protein